MNGFLRVIPVLFVLSAALLVAGCSKDEKTTPMAKQSAGQTATPTPTVKEVFNLAVEQLRNNQVEKAVTGFSLIIEKAYPGAPERAFAHAYLGQIALRSGKMPVAIEQFEAALKESPEMTPTRMALGNAYFAADRLDDAIAVWESLVKMNPNLPTVHNNLGVAYLDKNDLDNAIKHLEQTVAIAPDNARAHGNLATAYRKKGMETEALAAERKVAAIRARSRQSPK